MRGCGRSRWSTPGWNLGLLESFAKLSLSEAKSGLKTHISASQPFAQTTQTWHFISFHISAACSFAPYAFVLKLLFVNWYFYNVLRTKLCAIVLISVQVFTNESMKSLKRLYIKFTLQRTCFHNMSCFETLFRCSLSCISIGAFNKTCLSDLIFLFRIRRISALGI